MVWDPVCDLKKAKTNTDWVLTKDAGARMTYENNFKQCALDEGDKPDPVLEHDELIYRHAYAILYAQKHDAGAYCSLRDCIEIRYHVKGVPGKDVVTGIDPDYLEYLFYLRDKGHLAQE